MEESNGSFKYNLNASRGDLSSQFVWDRLCLHFQQFSKTVSRIFFLKIRSHVSPKHTPLTCESENGIHEYDCVNQV